MTCLVTQDITCKQLDAGIIFILPNYHMEEKRNMHLLIDFKNVAMTGEDLSFPSAEH